MNTVTLAEIYKTSINWPRWFKIVNVLGNQCNAMKNRFDKADILEQAIESCSNGRLKWVDLVGRDHHDEELNLDIEFKITDKGLESTVYNTQKDENKPAQKVIMTSMYNDYFNELIKILSIIKNKERNLTQIVQQDL